MRELLDAVRGAFAGEPAEVTLEVNPSTLERERLPAFRAAGVDRVSVGIQSFDDTTLRRLGPGAPRARGEAHARRVPRRRLRAPLARPDRGGARARTSRPSTASSRPRSSEAPDHVSVYELTLEPGTPFARAAERGRLATADEETAARMLERAEERLVAAGYRRYEISSYARPGREALHNQRYWDRRPVLGLGMGAVSNDPARGRLARTARAAPTRARSTPISRWRRARGAPRWRCSTPRAARGEAVFLALRTARGSGRGSASRPSSGRRRAHSSATRSRRSARRVCSTRADTGRLRLTPRGRMLSDSVFAHFV